MAAEPSWNTYSNNILEDYRFSDPPVFFSFMLPDGYLNHCLPPTMKSINTQVLRIHTVVSLHENNIK